jgi:hypothetical protein
MKYPAKYGGFFAKSWFFNKKHLTLIKKSVLFGKFFKEILNNYTITIV